MIHENLILKLPNDKELIFRFNEWNKYYTAHVYYEYKVDINNNVIYPKKENK